MFGCEHAALSWDTSLYDDVFDLAEYLRLWTAYFGRVDSSFFVVFLELGERPFRLMDFFRIGDVLVVYKVLGVLIHAKVGQMDVFFMDGLGAVLLRGKSSESILVDVDSQWVKACYQYIDPQIVLIAIDEMRGRDILGYQYLPSFLNFRIFWYKFDVSSARGGYWFLDPQLILWSCISGSLETFVIIGEDIGFWQIVVVFGEYFSHFLNSSP